MSSKWYFDGYEYRSRQGEGGKKPRRVMVYEGEYYGLGLPLAELRRLKAGAAALFILFVLLYLVLSLLPTEGARSPWVSLPLLAVLFPAIFLGMGFFCFLNAGEKWPRRLRRSIYHRLRWASLLTVILLLISLGGEIAACFRGTVRLAPELLYTAGLLLLLAVPLVILYFQRRYPVRVIV